jgi:HEPN domain-containing protein
MPGKRKAEARRWFQQALSDLRAVRWNIQGGFHDTACFLAQQAGEKALKSLLYYVGSRRSALLSHSLVAMIEAAKKQVNALAGLLDEARQLDLQYIPSRYPNGLPSGYPHRFYDKPMAEQAVAAAERILVVVRDHYQAQGEGEVLAPEDAASE